MRDYIRKSLIVIDKNMARTSTYLNFIKTTEDAFNYYKKVFGTNFVGDILRYKDMQSQDGKPIPESDQNLVMHVALPILGGHMLMGTDVIGEESLSFKIGNNVYINLEPDSKEETDRLFQALSVGWFCRDAAKRYVLG